jgi:hypothetical protein
MDDDLTVGGDVDLFRLVNPDLDIDWDHDNQRWLVKSRAFQNTTGTDRMSVVLGDVLEAEGRPPPDARRSKPEWYVVALTGRQVRTEDQGIVRNPIEEESAHGDVIGDKGRGRRRRFVRLARWIVEPPPPA